MSVNPPDKPERAEKPGDGAQGKPNSAPTARMAEAIGTRDESTSESQKWWRNPNHVIQAGTLLFVAVYTAVNAAILWYGIRSYDLARRSSDYTALDSAETMRAWVDASGVSGQPTPNANTTVTYMNVGREPAFGLVGHAAAKIAYIDPREGSDWERNSVWPKLSYLTEQNICAGVHPEPGRQALFVEGNSSGTLPVRFDPAEWGPLQGTQPPSHFAIVFGCLSYTTPHMKGERTTSFCYYFPPTPIPGIPSPPRCPTGNYAE